MKMPRGLSEIDRLIEQGLSLYGEGDLDGALVLWERALLIDPDNAQANSYVDYVKVNYDLLTNDANTEHSGPFAIGDDEPEYQIEILPGEDVEPAAPVAPLFMDAYDEGWMIGDESPVAPSALGSGSLTFKAGELHGLGIEPMSFETALTGESATFEDATREYPGGAGRPARSLLRELPIPAVPTRPAISAMPIAADPSDFVPEVTPAFGSAADLQTPPGFGTEVTEMRRRDLGFVQPSGEARGDRSGRVSGPPELKMTLRTPGALTLPPVAPPPQAVEPPRAPKLPAELDRHRTPTANGEPSEDRAAVEPPRADELALQLEASSPSSGYISLEIELTPVPDPSALDLIGRVDTRPAPPPAGALTPADEAVAESAANTVDLIMSLPTPRPPTTLTRQIPVPVRSRLSPESRPPGERPTGELSAELALPLAVGTAPTQELSLALKLDPQRTVHSEPAPTREFPAKPTPPRPPRPDDPLISAPTRDLGLRAASRPVSEDETTRELEVQKPRKPRGTVKPELPAMDPIDARSAEILEEIDRNAPANEVREDRTRRRITALLDRATSWSASAEHERSVTAVDLALSEDPNSALAQKLIHRNREVIMNAFQAFLGDLQRTPSLARPLHELASAPISPRAAFLLSRVDGTLSLDEILDVSGMPRLEAYRYLCQLFLRGILR